MTPLEELSVHIDEALREASRVAERVVLLTGGNMGLIPICPAALRWYYGRRTRQVRELFMEATASHDACYVDMFFTSWGEVWKGDPLALFAPDGLHPSSTGYALWFERIQRAIDEAGLELAA